MGDLFNRFLEKAADFFAEKPGLLPVLALILIAINFLLRLFPGAGNWLVETDLLLHVGLILGFVGLLIIRPLG